MAAPVRVRACLHALVVGIESRVVWTKSLDEHLSAVDQLSRCCTQTLLLSSPVRQHEQGADGADGHVVANAGDPEVRKILLEDTHLTPTGLSPQPSDHRRACLDAVDADAARCQGNGQPAGAQAELENATTWTRGRCQCCYGITWYEPLTVETVVDRRVGLAVLVGRSISGGQDAVHLTRRGHRQSRSARTDQALLRR